MHLYFSEFPKLTSLTQIMDIIGLSQEKKSNREIHKMYAFKHISMHIEFLTALSIMNAGQHQFK